MKLFTREYLSFNQELKEEWLELESRSNISMFQNYHWNLYWYNNNKENKKYRLRIISIKDESSQTVAIFPCVVNYLNGFSILRFCGYNISDYGMPLIDKKIKEEIILKKIFSAFLNYNKKYDLIHLEKIPDNFNNNSIFFSKITNLKKKYNAYRINLKTIKNKKKIIPKKIRLDTNRQFKRLNKLGLIKYDHENDSKKFNDLVKNFIIFKNRRIKHQGQRNIFKDRDIYEFYNNINNIKSELIEIIFSVLTLDNEEIAITFGAIFRDTYYYIMPTFSSKYQRYSVGKILLQNQIETISNRNIYYYDFTIGDENYKKKYCNEDMQIYELMDAKKIRGKIFIFFYQIFSKVTSSKRIRSVISYVRKIIN